MNTAASEGTEAEERARPRMRPRFEVELDVPADRVLAQLRRRLAARDATVAGVVLPRQVELRVPHARAHFWSPSLSLEIDREDDGATCLRGRFAPEPSVWMMFMGLYGTLGMGGTLASMFGVSQWIANEPAWAFVGVPIALALMAFVYGAAFIGQGLAASEMYALRSFVDHAIEAAREESEALAQ